MGLSADYISTRYVHRKAVMPPDEIPWALITVPSPAKPTFLVHTKVSVGDSRAHSASALGSAHT